MTTTTQDRDLQLPGAPEHTPRGHLGLIVSASLATGLVAALALVAAPFIPAKENVLTGVVLLAFALGWALLAVLSTRFSTRPQRWAAAPAVFFAVAGLVSLLGSETVRDVFGWVWPPALLALVVWMIIRVRRQVRSRAARWLLYPVLAMLMVAAVGGGYETARESSTPGSTRCLGSWSTWAGTGCTSIAPARAAPRSSWNRVRAAPPPTLVGSRPRWPGTAQCAYMTAPAEGGATPPTTRRTLPG